MNDLLLSTNDSLKLISEGETSSTIKLEVSKVINSEELLSRTQFSGE